MSNFFNQLLTQPYLQLAFFSALVASISSGIMGSYVVVKKISSITGSISHSILAGIGFFQFLQYKYNLVYFDPLFGAFLAGILSALLIGFTHIYFKQKEDAVIATIWSVGMSIGIIFLTLVPGGDAACTHYLFGDLFTTSAIDIVFLSSLALLIIFLTIIFYNKFLIICFDEDLAYLQKIKKNLLYFLLLILISTAIVFLVKIIGVILVIALITIPPTIANQFTFKMPKMMLIAILLAAIFNSLGIYFSYTLSMPPGAVTSIIIGIFYLISLGVKRFYSYE